MLQYSKSHWPSETLKQTEEEITIQMLYRYAYSYGLRWTWTVFLHPSPRSACVMRYSQHCICPRVTTVSIYLIPNTEPDLDHQCESMLWTDPSATSALNICNIYNSLVLKCTSMADKIAEEANERIFKWCQWFDKPNSRNLMILMYFKFFILLILPA